MIDKGDGFRVRKVKHRFSFIAPIPICGPAIRWVHVGQDRCPLVSSNHHRWKGLSPFTAQPFPTCSSKPFHQTILLLFDHWSVCSKLTAFLLNIRTCPYALFFVTWLAMICHSSRRGLWHLVTKLPTGTVHANYSKWKGVSNAVDDVKPDINVSWIKLRHSVTLLGAMRDEWMFPTCQLTVNYTKHDTNLYDIPAKRHTGTFQIEEYRSRHGTASTQKHVIEIATCRKVWTFNIPCYPVRANWVATTFQHVKIS